MTEQGCRSTAERRQYVRLNAAIPVQCKLAPRRLRDRLRLRSAQVSTLTSDISQGGVLVKWPREWVCQMCPTRQRSGQGRRLCGRDQCSGGEEPRSAAAPHFLVSREMSVTLGEPLATEPIRAFASIVHTREGQPEHMLCVGLKFLDLDAAARERIGAFVRDWRTRPKQSRGGTDSQVRLTFLGSSARPEFEELLLSRHTTYIGRGPWNDVRVGSPRVAEQHAAIDVEEERPRVFDLFSETGTFVNRRRVKVGSLSPGDEIMCGDVRFVYSDTEPAAGSQSWRLDEEFADRGRDEGRDKMLVCSYGGLVTVHLMESHVVPPEVVDAIGAKLMALADRYSHMRMVINFEKVRHLSSALLGKLIALHKKVAADHGVVALCCLNPSIYEIFRLTKLHKVLKICVDQAEAEKCARRLCATAA